MNLNTNHTFSGTEDGINTEDELGSSKFLERLEGTKDGKILLQRIEDEQNKNMEHDDEYLNRKLPSIKKIGNIPIVFENNNMKEKISQEGEDYFHKINQAIEELPKKIKKEFPKIITKIVITNTAENFKSISGNFGLIFTLLKGFHDLCPSIKDIKNIIIHEITHNKHNSILLSNQNFQKSINKINENTDISKFKTHRVSQKGIIIWLDNDDIEKKDLILLNEKGEILKEIEEDKVYIYDKNGRLLEKDIDIDIDITIAGNYIFKTIDGKTIDQGELIFKDKKGNIKSNYQHLTYYHVDKNGTIVNDSNILTSFERHFKNGIYFCQDRQLNYYYTKDKIPEKDWSFEQIENYFSELIKPKGGFIDPYAGIKKSQQLGDEIGYNIDFEYHPEQITQIVQRFYQYPQQFFEIMFSSSNNQEILNLNPANDINAKYPLLRETVRLLIEYGFLPENLMEDIDTEEIIEDTQDDLTEILNA